MTSTSKTVRIVSKLFVLPNGDSICVQSHQPYTSRSRATGYVKRKAARWENDRQEAIYFIDPKIVLRQTEEKRSGSHGWAVRDSGGSALMKAGTARGIRAGVSGGYRVLQSGGGRHEFDKEAYARSLSS